MNKKCNNCQKELGDNWVNIIKVDWTDEEQGGNIHFHINSQQSVGEFCKDCLTLVKDNYNNHVFDVNLNNGAWKMSKCPWCEQSQGGVMYLQDCSRILEHYMECDKKKHLHPPSEKKSNYQHYSKCLKCGNISDISWITISYSWEQKSELQKLAKEGCSSCKSKNLEWKITTMDGEEKWITDECSQCHQPKVVDIPNWEEIKGQYIKSGVKTKQELINKMNKEWKQFCYCNVDNDREREREREREQNWGTPQANC